MGALASKSAMGLDNLVFNSGSGKSTFLTTICGRLQTDSRIKVEGNIHLGSKALRANVTSPGIMVKHNEIHTASLFDRTHQNTFICIGLCGARRQGHHRRFDR